MTVWSQRRRTVTLAMRVRGAVSAEASVEGNKLHFRYFLQFVAFVKVDLSAFKSVMRFIYRKKHCQLLQYSYVF